MITKLWGRQIFDPYAGNSIMLPQLPYLIDLPQGSHVHLTPPSRSYSSKIWKTTRHSASIQEGTHWKGSCYLTCIQQFYEQKYTEKGGVLPCAPIEPLLTLPSLPTLVQGKGRSWGVSYAFGYLTDEHDIGVLQKYDSSVEARCQHIKYIPLGVS